MTNWTRCNPDEGGVAAFGVENGFNMTNKAYLDYLEDMIMIKRLDARLRPIEIRLVSPL